MPNGKRSAETRQRARGDLEDQSKISFYLISRPQPVLCDRGSQGPLVAHSSQVVHPVPVLHLLYRWLSIGLGF